jgi:hypothetical protein
MRENMMRIAILLVLTLAIVGCPDPGTTPTVYERIVIDTYSPNNSLTADTYIDLFDASGDPDADDPWSGDDTGDAIAYDDNGNPDWPGTYARIDYTGGLASGTYYIRVRGAADTVDDYYTIRVLSLKISDSLPLYDFPGSVGLKYDDYEPDDSPKSGGIPTNPVPIAIGNTNWINRALDYDTGPPAEGDIDWFELVLP